MSDVSRGSLTAEQAAEYTDALTRHYGEPVRPVSEYCNAFRTWGDAIRAKLARIDAGEEEEYLAEEWREVVAALGRVEIPIFKSNLLARLIYGGEKLRTRPCPEHRGRWSGCEWGPIKCGCGAGANVTGWLAEDSDAATRHVGGPVPMMVLPPESEGGRVLTWIPEDTMSEAHDIRGRQVLCPENMTERS